MLDQVRSEFGVEVEIVDANLSGAWAPEGQRAPRLLAGPELRAIGLDVLRAGRASVVSVDGREYQLVPLRNSRSVSPTALMAMRLSTVVACQDVRRQGQTTRRRRGRSPKQLASTTGSDPIGSPSDRTPVSGHGSRCCAGPSKPICPAAKKSTASVSRRAQCGAR